jgi:hypothetical protein
MRGDTFQALADALGITSSGLRRWANRGRVPGAALIRGKWILRGPLTIRRIEKIRSFLNLKPLIAKGRRGENPKPEKKKRKRDKIPRAVRIKRQRQLIAKTRKDLQQLERWPIPKTYAEMIERDRLRKRLERLKNRRLAPLSLFAD